MSPSLFSRATVLPALLVLASSLSAQHPPAGEVLTYTKLSKIRGGPPHPGLSFSDQFGRACSGIGDLDGDGVGDLIVGAHGVDDGGVEAGFVPDPEDPFDSANLGGAFICLLNPNGSFKRITKISATSGGFTGKLDPKDEFGRAVAGIGDFDRDGIPDVAVGANKDDDGRHNAGALYLLFLRADGTVREHKKISATEGGLAPGLLDNGDEFGRDIACMGDLDGDGVEDLAIGVANDDDGARSSGAVYILFMNRDGTVKSHQKISNTQGGLGAGLSNDHSFGMSVANLGDVDGDGVVDLGVGGIGDPTGGFQTGSAFVLFLNSNGTVKHTQVINDRFGGWGSDVLSPVEQFGFGITGLGDLDGDGVRDMAVGAILNDADAVDENGQEVTNANYGAVYILFLHPDGTIKNYQRINNAEGGLGSPLRMGDWWGASLGNVGDLNGDGTQEIVAGARFDNDGGNDMGAVYVLFLSNGGLTPPSPVFTSTPPNGSAPWTVTFEDQTLGSVNSRLWDFGDGTTSTERDPVHTYETPGVYDVSLHIEGAGGEGTTVRQGFAVISAALPVAAFTPLPRTGPAPLEVTFLEESTGTIDRWAWSFGDGTVAFEKDVTHVYDQPGTYSVGLRAIGPAGVGEYIDPEPIVVVPPGPQTAFELAPEIGDSPLSVSFTDTSVGEVTSWLWDFGDGATSTAQHPVHTYTGGGTFDVTLSAWDAIGVTTLTRADAVVVDPPAPLAALELAPLDGVAPLTITYADASEGRVSSWSWDFGDGGGSQLPAGTHVYTEPGTYLVSLTARGPGGAGFVQAAEPVVVSSVPAGISDGGFEGQVSGQAPEGAWTQTGGTWVFVHPLTGGSDNGFPSDGSQWLEVNAGGTDGATPPSNPGGFTDPPQGGAGVTQSFRVSPEEPVLVFDAAFLRNGPAGSPSANDWMSVDVTDGSDWWNLYYADTFTPTAFRSEVYGVQRTTTQRVQTDLSELFTALGPQDVLTLSVQVGNGGDALLPSSGFVDGFRLVEALDPGPPDPPEPSEDFERYGCGTNPVGSLSVLSGEPRLGTPIVFGIDNPLGTMAPGSLSVLSVSLAPDPGFPCGTPLPTWGMDPLLGAGELLIVLTQPDFLLRFNGTTWGGPGSPAQVTVPLPPLPALSGTTAYVQGLLVDPTGSGQVPRGLTDGLFFVVVP